MKVVKRPFLAIVGNLSRADSGVSLMATRGVVRYRTGGGIGSRATATVEGDTTHDHEESAAGG